MAAMNFDATQVEPQSDFEALPAGEYLVIADASEAKQTKDNKGEYLQFTLKVLDGPYKNRLIFDRITTINNNQSAVEIGRRSLSALCHAVGVLQPRDSAQLHGIPFIARLGITAARDGYDPTNNIKAYKSASGAKSTVSTTPAYTAPQRAAESAPQHASAEMPPPNTTAATEVKQAPPWAKR